SCNISNICSKFEPIGSHLFVQGWVKAMRNMKTNVFVDISDGSCSQKLQVLTKKIDQPQTLTYGAAVRANGPIVKNKNGQLELVAKELSVIGPCTVSEGYPFAPRKIYNSDYIRQFLHLRPRTNSFAALLRVRAAMSRAVNDYFCENSYIQIHTPIITSNDCEGAGEVFRVRPDNELLVREMAKKENMLEEAYFDTKAFLTVSGQLHLEAVVRGLSKVYTFGPTFRAENSRTRLHLAEFYMIEAEKAFLVSLEDLMKIIEDMIKTVTNKVADKCAADLQTLHSSNNNEGSIISILGKQFEVMTYDKAIDILEKHSENFVSQVKRGNSLAKEHELFLVKYAGDCPVFFYSIKVSALDLLTPRVGELCGGSLREDDFSNLENKLKKLDLQESLNWYLELRKYGNVPSGGFGMGFERFLQLVLGIPNIKDTIPFPRWPHNCKL
ncbi:hypothetical protein L9F63_012990, partial [Diploptera punctata]